MPVESVPSLRPGRDILRAPATLAAGPVNRLARTDVAPGEAVEPLMRSARSAVASLTLKVRAAEQAARAAEAAAAADDGIDHLALEAERSARLGAVAVDVELRRRDRDAAVDQARRDAEALLASAREEAIAVVAAARDDLELSLGSLLGAPPLPTMAAPITAAAVLSAAASVVPAPAPVPEPEPEPVPIEPRPAAGPTYPPPSPQPTLPPPMVAAPLAPTSASYTTVLVQAADGFLRPALVLTSGQFGVPAAPALQYLAAAAVAPGPQHLPATTTAPVAAAALLPAPVAEPSPALPAAGAGRRLLHLDVLLPLVAVAIVLVVLLAWLG